MASGLENPELQADGPQRQGGKRERPMGAAGSHRDPPTGLPSVISLWEAWGPHERALGAQPFLRAEVRAALFSYS